VPGGGRAYAGPRLLGQRVGKRANRRALPKRVDPDEVIFRWQEAVPEFEAEAAKVPKVELDDDNSMTTWRRSSRCSYRRWLSRRRWAAHASPQ
jgi:predicted nucleic acid-binding Zn ribbon protein